MTHCLQAAYCSFASAVEIRLPALVHLQVDVASGSDALIATIVWLFCAIQFLVTLCLPTGGRGLWLRCPHCNHRWAGRAGARPRARQVRGLLLAAPHPPVPVSCWCSPPVVKTCSKLEMPGLLLQNDLAAAVRDGLRALPQNTLPHLPPPVRRGGRGGRGRGGRGATAVSAVAGEAAAALGLGVGKKKRGKKGKAVGLVEKSALAKEFEKVGRQVHSGQCVVGS